MTALPWKEVHTFFDYLNLEGSGLAEVSGNCGKAIAVLAKYIPIGRVEACVQAPRNRLRPEGEFCMRVTRRRSSESPAP